MKESRVIRIIGAIDEAAFKTFCEELHELEKSSNKDIILELSSGGGSSYDALGFAGRIRNSPCEIIIHAYGLVASAAVIILASGDLRKMARESWVMVHEDSDRLRGNVVELEREANHLRRMEDQWANLLFDLTDTEDKKWNLLHKRTTYLTATECKSLGLIDEVI